MDSTIPVFRYHPDPIKTGAVKQKQTECPVCNRECEYVYEGPFYSADEVEGICPWCIKNGDAAKIYDGKFQDDFLIEVEIKKEYLEELVFRTPSYSSWQQSLWLVHCDEPCAFVDYVGWDEIKDIKDNLQDDIEKIKKNRNMSQDVFENSLKKGGNHQGYLFKCIHCGQYRLTSDFD